jgi:uncharacterized protein YdaU (DUF1376 family)
MNYYEHHIGDYAEATGHLSFAEDAAYSRLVRKYYASEKPLPSDLKAVQRLVGARSKEERDAVETVLAEFFTLSADGWRNKRCDEEIARYQDKQAKAKRSADARWSKSKTHSEGNANASPNAMRTHSEGNAHQAPSTKHQTPDVNPLAQAASELQPVERERPLPAAADAVTGRAIELASLLIKRGAALQASDPRVRGWATNGVTDTQALQALDIANERRSQQANPAAVNAGFLDAILGDVTRPPAPQRRTIHDDREAVSIALTGRKPNHDRPIPNAERDITGEAVRVA